MQVQEQVQTTITQNFYDDKSSIKSNMSLDSINSFEELVVENPITKHNTNTSLFRKGSQPTNHSSVPANRPGSKICIR